MNLYIVPIQPEEQWLLTEECYDADRCKYYEGLFTQGNGYMHVRGSYEEGLHDAVQDEEYQRLPSNVTLEKHRNSKSKWGTYIPGIVGVHPYLKTEGINLPYFLALQLRADDEELDMELGEISEYTRQLNMQDGSLRRAFIWKTRSGMVLQAEYLRFISKADSHLALQQLRLQVLVGEGSLEMRTGIDAGVRTNGFNHFTQVSEDVNTSPYIGLEVITNGGNTVSMMSTFDAPDMQVEQEVQQESVWFLAKKKVKAGDSLTLVKTTAVCTDHDKDDRDPKVRCELHLENAVSKGYQKLYEAHVQEWKKRWKASDIVITGDDKAQKAIRMSIYHLIRANNELDERVAICAKGFAGEAYFGHFFWDTEINMLPFFIHTNPKAARNLLKFRYVTLDGARRNAKVYGYKGARYPWESACTGDEECPNWQYADHEIHITADVIYAMIHYARATGDYEFVYKYGMEMMIETARYWLGRVDRNKDGYYELLGVMGPDEYLPLTRNNTFTNRMVKFSLEETIQCLGALRENDNYLYHKVCDKTNFKAEEIAAFREVKDGLKISYDENTRIVPQSDDFEDYADIDFDELWKDRSKCFGMFISQEKNYRSKALKQADVLELMMLYPNEFSMEQLSDNYNYYEPITTHDSSLSAAVHGILATWMGRMEEANRFLDKVIEIDMSPEKKGAEEGIHIANCGGLWQMVVYGFAGLNSAMWNDKIQLQPHLPKHWSRLEIPITWHDRQYQITITQDEYHICERKE